MQNLGQTLSWSAKSIARWSSLDFLRTKPRGQICIRHMQVAAPLTELESVDRSKDRREAKRKTCPHPGTRTEITEKAHNGTLTESPAPQSSMTDRNTFPTKGDTNSITTRTTTVGKKTTSSTTTIPALGCRNEMTRPSSPRIMQLGAFQLLRHSLQLMPSTSAERKG